MVPGPKCTTKDAQASSQIPCRNTLGASMRENQRKCFMCSKYLHGNAGAKFIISNITMVFLRIDNKAESWLVSESDANQLVTRRKTWLLKMVLKQMIFLE